MYGARLVEVADTDNLFDTPHHPYTQGLIQSIPVRGRPLRAIPDTIFDLRTPPPGCRFHPRCRYAQPKCSQADPRLETSPDSDENTRVYACHFPLNTGGVHGTVDCEEGNGQKEESVAVACSDPMIQPFLSVRGLRRYFDISGGTVSRLLYGKRILKAVDDVSFDVGHGQTLAVVGESGSGKSTTARLIARLLPAMGGEVILNDRNLLEIPMSEMRTIRKRIQFVFQDPFSSLNPRMEVEETIGRSLTLHFGLTGQDRRRRVRELLEQVGLSRDHLHRFPHQFSGGQRQRIAVARALASEPDLILADEPVSSLDVSIQAQVLELLQDLRKRLNLTMVFITHDLNVAEFVSDRVAVMYGGKIMEQGPVETVLRQPLHPYTKALLEGRPRIERRREPLRFPEGEPSVPINATPGCRFASRCPIRVAACTEDEIPLVSKRPDHQVACIRV
jgi:peptide/nickel transport system ATP-binding protein